MVDGSLLPKYVKAPPNVDVREFFGSIKGAASMRAPSDDAEGRIAVDIMAKSNDQSSIDMVMLAETLRIPLAGHDTLTVPVPTRVSCRQHCHRARPRGRIRHQGRPC